MNAIRSAVRLLKQPQTISTRLIEKMMAARSEYLFRRYTPALCQAERLAFFAHVAPQEQIDMLAAEAREMPTYRWLEDIRTVSSPENQIINAQTTSLEDCITMYILVRLYAPQVMVETGVYYGALSAMILSAMQRNGGGGLYSIDLPIETDGLPASMRGGLVTEAQRPNWKLILGDSRVELPPLLDRLGSVDMFNHDSLHTTGHMTWEYEAAWPRLRPGGVLSSHDVMLTPAWGRFCKRHAREISYAGSVYGLGIVVKRK